MMAIVTLLTGALAALTSIKGISVVPVEDRTEVIIEVDGPVTVEHFLLGNPDRLVVDLSTARRLPGQTRFDAIHRGGVVALRIGQFRPDVVRVVVELEQPVEYRVEQEGERIRVSFPNPDGAFAPWSTGATSAGAVDAAAPPPEHDARAEEAPGEQAARADSFQEQERPAVSQEPRITIYFDNVDILDVLATFAEFSGRSIVPGVGVTGTVTADIRNQPWDEALDVILASRGLAARELESGIIRVDLMSKLRELEASEPLETRHFQIRYARADSSLVKTVQGLLSDSMATVTANPATNTIVVTDRASVIRDRIAPMIEQLDVRTPQVQIEAKIVFVDRTSLENLGIVYDLKDSRGNQLNRLSPGGIDENGDGIITGDEQTNQNVVRLGGPSIAALANANFRPTPSALEVVTTLVLNRYSLLTFVDALSSLEYSDVQARPTLATMDHRPAQVHVGERTPVRVVDAGSAGGGGGGSTAPVATVRFENTGIILAVTPHVTGDQVLLELHAERSSVALAPSDIGFTFQTQATDTQILLKDGETGVISGMTIIEKDRVRVGIPFLMDLPVIGALFRTTTEEESRQDLLIMVTPHIIREAEA
ncbi:MAG TPA: AMIN domain-containing protein [Longimicrobiales bacterium]